MLQNPVRRRNLPTEQLEKLKEEHASHKLQEQLSQTGFQPFLSKSSANTSNSEKINDATNRAFDADCVPNCKLSRAIPVELGTLAWRNTIYIKNHRLPSPRDRKLTSFGQGKTKQICKILHIGELKEPLKRATWKCEGEKWCSPFSKTTVNNRFPHISNLLNENIKYSKLHNEKNMKQIDAIVWPNGKMSRTIPVQLEALNWRNKIDIKNHRLLSPRHRKLISFGQRKFGKCCKTRPIGATPQRGNL